MRSKILFAALLTVFLGIANLSSARDGNFAKTPANGLTENRHHHHHHHHRHHRHMRNGGMNKGQAYHTHHRYSRQERSMAYRHNGRPNRHDRFRWDHKENRGNHGIVRI
jgi:hypothetical protein